MIKYFISTTLLIIFSMMNLTYAQQEEPLTEEQKQYLEWAQSLWESMDQQTGEIKLPNNVATLSISEDFYYLSTTDAEKVLVDIWGNPPGAETLGMIFPIQYTPFDKAAWAVMIQYEEDGYVSDKDTNNINYTELLAQMQDDTQATSKERVAAGYEPIKLVGWAAQPHYDSTEKKLYWAKELVIGENTTHTLNYNIRILGRKGVLVLNFIAGMPQLEEINQNLESVLALANFNEGSRYADFNPDIDKVAAYGIGALVAGKVLSKIGMIAGLLLFLKKFWILIAIGIGGLFKVLLNQKNKHK